MQVTSLPLLLLTRFLVVAMASGTDSHSTNQSGTAPSDMWTDSDAPSLLPNLDDLSPAQAQRVLEAALQHYRAADMTPASGTGSTVTTASLLNGGLLTTTASSGECP